MNRLTDERKVFINKELQTSLRRAVIAFLTRELPKFYGDSWWENGVKKAVSKDKVKKLGDEPDLRLLDIADCLVVLENQYNAEKIFNNIDNRIRPYASQLIIERNGSSHINDFEQFEEHKFAQAMMTVICLIEAIADADAKAENSPVKEYIGKTMSREVLALLSDSDSLLAPGTHQVSEQLRGLRKRIAPGNYAAGKHSDNEMFDREGMPELIHNKLLQHSEVYIQAKGGVGKSRLAYAYCQSGFSEKYEYVFWIEAVSSDIRTDIMREPLFGYNLQNDENLNEDTRFKSFISEFKTDDKSVLLVIDGVETKAQLDCIELHLPALQWDIIITTRAAKAEKTFLDKTIELGELLESHCEDVFYANYRWEKSEEDKADLHELFKALHYNTLLISMFAKEGTYSVSELLEIYKEADAQCDVYQSYRNAIKDLYDASTLTPDEQTTLGYFTLLPSSSIPKKVLMQWFAREGVNLNNTFRALTQKGWLMMSGDPVNMNFQCHSLVTSALKDQVKIGAGELECFINNLADFLHFPMSEYNDNINLIGYFDHINSVLENYGEKNEAMFRLKLNYLTFMNRVEFAHEKAIKLAEDIKNNYKEFYESNHSDEFMAVRLQVLMEYATAFNFTAGVSVDNRNAIAVKLREEACELARSFLKENDMRRLEAEHRLVMAQRAFKSEYYAYSIDEYIRIKKIVEAEISSTADVEKRDRIYFYSRILQAMGYSYGKLRPRTVETTKNALNSYRKALETSALIYGEYSIALRVHLNNVGCMLVELYKIDQKGEYLAEAENLLTRSHDLRAKHYPHESSSVAMGKSNLAFLYIEKKEFATARQFAEESLNIRKAVFSDENNMTSYSYSRLAEAQLGLYEENRDPEMLNQALANAEKSVQIAERLFAENPNIYDERVKILKKIKKVAASV